MKKIHILIRPVSYVCQHHKCGYANCPICKNAILNSSYWHHIRSHPGHENDSPPARPPPTRKTFENTEKRITK
jgi:hypothetical protein